MEIASTLLTAYGGFAQENALIAAAIFTRLSVLFLFLPGIGERAVSVRIRLIAALAVMLVLAPAITITTTPPETASGIAALFGAEALCGALIGFSIRISLFAISTAGVIASQSMSLAQLLGSNVSYDLETPISNILLFAGVVLALTAGVHFEAIGALLLSYEFLPIGQFPGASATGEWAADRVAVAFAAALSLALPFVILAFIYNLALGAANRAMPQLMVAFVGIPAITLAGLILLAVSAPILLDVWLDITRDLITEFLTRLQ